MIYQLYLNLLIWCNFLDLDFNGCD